MLGFIRRLFGIYTIKEMREKGRRYVWDTIDDVARLTDNNEEAEAGILLELTAEWTNNRESAMRRRNGFDMAFANGMQDALEEWLVNKDAMETIKVETLETT